MGLLAVAETAEVLGQIAKPLTEADQEYVIQFAFRTGDKELTNKLIDELSMPDADSQRIYQKYQTMVDFQPEWIRKIEDLLISLERYRVQEDKAIRSLTEVLSAYGITVTKEVIRNTDVNESKIRLKKEASL